MGRGIWDMRYGIWGKGLGIIFNMFRMTQNCSKCIQRVKKVKNAPIFSNHAEIFLTLINLTHLCTNFVLVLYMFYPFHDINSDVLI